MRGKLWLVVLFLLALGGGAAWFLLRPAPQAPVAGGAIGSAIAVDPAATIATPPGAAEVARLQAPVHADDLIATGADGAIRVQFTDASFFSVGANAKVTIDSYVFDPERNASKFSLGFTRGAFRFVSGAPVHAYPGQPAVKTPVAVIGIRGTGLAGVIGPEAEALYRLIDRTYVPDGGDIGNATLILLTAGAIDVDGSGVRTSLDVPGQVVFFRRPGAPPLRPRGFSLELIARILGLASPPELGPEPGGDALPSPSPTSIPTPVAQPIPTPEPGRPLPSPSPTIAPSPVASPSFTPRPTPTPRFTPRPVPTLTPTPTPTPRFTPRPTPTPRFTPRPTPTPRFTPRPTPTATPRIPDPRFTPRPRPTFTPTISPNGGPVRTRSTPTPTPRPVQ
jgi:hypothetical protein